MGTEQSKDDNTQPTRSEDENQSQGEQRNKEKDPHSNRRELDRDDRDRTRSGNTKEGMVKFFMWGSGVLIILIAVVAFFRFGLPMIRGGNGDSGGTQNPDHATWKEVEKEANKHLSRGNKLYQDAGEKNSVKLYREAIGHYEKGKERIKTYARKSDWDEYHRKNVWQNLTSMSEKAEDKMDKIQEDSGEDIPIAGNGNTSNKQQNDKPDKITIPELNKLKSDDRKKLETAVDHINTINSYLHKIDTGQEIENREQKIEKMEKLRQKAETIIFNLSDRYEGKQNISSYLQSLKFDHLIKLKNELGGIRDTK